MLPAGVTDWFTLHGLLTVLGLLVYAVGSQSLHQRRHPSAAIAWILFILLVPEAGLPLYLLFGTRKLPKAQVRQPVREIELREVDAAVAPGWAVHLTASMGLAPPVSYTGLRLHRDGADAARALREVIESATEELDVCTFILGRDRFGTELLELLGERAAAGVRVRLIVDGVGALMGGRRDFAVAASKGVEAVRFAPPLRSPFKWPLRGRTNLRNHRKLVVADRQRMWSGGRNLAGEYFEGRDGQPPWLDLSFDLEGAVAAEAAAVFEGDWRFANNPREADMGAPGFGVWSTGEIRPPAAQLIPSGPDYADDTVHTLLVTSFHRARGRILLVTPYFVPDEAMLTAMVLAARRGVEVDLVVPARSNHLLADIARNRPIRDLARAGGRIWLTPMMVHAKAVVIDEHMALAGSVNMDSRSLFLNYELMTAFYSPPDIRRFAAFVETLRAHAERHLPRPPELARAVGEGLVLWLAFQL